MSDKGMGRRRFLKYSAATLGVSLMGTSPSFSAGSKKDTKLYKALKIGMLPKKLSDAEKFKLAKRCGFDGIDGEPMEDHDAAEEQAQLARDAGVPIHGLVFGGWHAPFSEANPKVIQKGLAGMENALRCANAMKATTVLLVPALVKENVSYGDAYKRSQKHIRELIPLAEEVKVIIAIENVWNKFLLSPLEFARYIDEFESPWVRVYFDVGNVIIHGYAQDWIRTLNKRIVKIDLKDFKRAGYKWTNLGDGDVNWAEVRRALDEIGFEGYMTAELEGGDEAYLSDLAQRIDELIIKAK
ncbi:MAG: sugar phosphate isomerase/epimerase [Planctomycetota bacterium]|nr:MAG: sugar phosphate isomerase/epimerase [Planctomycetota bacterium]